MGRLRIAIPVDRNDKNSNVFEHFGRAPYFLIADVDTDTRRVESIDILENKMVEHSPGEIPRFLARNGVNIIICMGIGRRARQFLQEFGIQVVSGAQGSAIDCIERFIRGELHSEEYYPRRRWGL